MAAPQWTELYGVLGAISVLDKDVPKVVKALHDEGQSQMADVEERSPCWTTLGQVTGGDAGFEQSKAWWVAFFEDKDAYHVSHKQAQAKESRAAFIPALMGMMATGSPVADMAGGYMGPILHLEAPKSVRPATFAILIKITCPTADAARALVQAHKRLALVTLMSSRGTCCRISMLPPGGDAPGADDNVVHILEQWTNMPDYESFIVMPGRSATPSPTLSRFIADKRDVRVMSFDKKVCHYNKKR